MRELSEGQARALAKLGSQMNCFLTGAAGTGKSHVVSRLLADRDPTRTPVLASTGAAAILVGGRTFHSFFGLGILEGGPEETVKRALGKKHVVKRLRKAEGVVIDEVSMIPGRAFDVAERIARGARGGTSPWGGLRVVAVGDFAQLPPVNPHGEEKDWAFHSDAWERSELEILALTEVMRTSEPGLLRALAQLRLGRLDGETRAFLDSRMAPEDRADAKATRLFPRRDQAERFNLDRLAELRAPIREFPTAFAGDARALDSLRKNAPVPDVIRLKEGARVILRQNDPEGAWVNGSTGTLKDIADETLVIDLDGRGSAVVPKTKFSLLDAEGKEAASAVNFPVNLAYALTIHKAQGATLARVRVDLRGAWEHGQGYVAASRVRAASGLILAGWTPQAFRQDPDVETFHRESGIA